MVDIRNRFIYFLLLSFLWLSGLEAADLSDLDIHGFISQGYLLSKENNHLSADTTVGSFQFNELGINFGKSLTDELWVGLQLFSRDLGRTGNNDVEVDWAFGDCHWRDGLGVRAGLMKDAPWSLQRESGPGHASFRHPSSPECLSRIDAGLLYADMGLGNIRKCIQPSFGTLSYQLLAGSYNQDVQNSSLSVIVSGGCADSVEDSENGMQYSAGLVWDPPFDGLRRGLSFQ